MKYNREDLPKIIVLGLVLVALIAYIGVSYSKLSSRYREQEAKHRAQHPPTAGGQATAGTPGNQAPMTPAVAALIAPVVPPGRDPFSPVIPPRRWSSAPSAAASGGAKGGKKAPLAPVLPPLVGVGVGTGTVSSHDTVLALTGIILGPPTLAVLRRGEDHFIVKQGDQLPGRFRVQAITRTSVTLRDGKQEFVLRLGG